MALTTFIGGGITVFTAVLYTIISDVTSSTQRYGINPRGLEPILT